MKYYYTNFVPLAYIIQEGLLQNKFPNNIDHAENKHVTTIIL